MSVSVVSVDYLNTYPLRSHLSSLVENDSIRLDLEHPARAVDLLAQGHYQLGLLPVAAQLDLPTLKPVGRYGISCNGEVGSVGIFSNVPITEITHLHLDPNSRSSVLLGQILLKDYWQITPRIIRSFEHQEAATGQKAAKLIIGDPALAARKQFRFYYDLGKAWKEYSGLPFVFARWLATESLDSALLAQFESCQREGVLHRLRSAVELEPTAANVNLVRYFIRQLCYRLTDEAERGEQLFLEKAAALVNRNR